MKAEIMNSGKRVKIFLLSLAITLLSIRVFLYFFPATNLNIGGDGIHHLYSGAFLSILALTLLVAGITGNFTLVFAGFSSALVLDQLVFLVATDGMDLKYTSKTSLFGALISALIVA